MVNTKELYKMLAYNRTFPNLSDAFSMFFHNLEFRNAGHMDAEKDLYKKKSKGNLGHKNLTFRSVVTSVH